MGGTSLWRRGRRVLEELKTTTNCDSKRDCYPYTVVVMGAGCSKGLGLPLLSGFMDKAFDYRPGLNSKKTSRQDYELWLSQIGKFVQRVKASRAYIQSDLLNVEELYGLADLYDILNPGEGSDAKEALRAFRSVILALMADGGRELVDPAYSLPDTRKALEQIKLESRAYDLLVKNEGTKHATLLAYLCIATHKDIDDSRPLFVQFNWDMALDRALCRAYFRTSSAAREEGLLRVPDAPERIDIQKNERIENVGDTTIFRIGISSDNPDDPEPLFPWMVTDSHVVVGRYKEFPVVAKPHGALNWILSDKSPLACASLADTGVSIDQRMVQYPNRYANYEALRSCMKIIPPTWRKEISDKAFTIQWKEIEHGLRHCRRLVFVGYSMPITDVYFRHFLALAMASNNRMPNVYVWNPSVFKPSPARTSYLETFAPLAAEGRLFGIRDRFGEPAVLDLNRAVQSAERLDPNPS
jgi:hypothetical protein